MQDRPTSAYSEIRKCPHCKKDKIFNKNEAYKYCEDCRDYARTYKHAHKTYKPSKEDIAEKERNDREKAKELSLKYQTTEFDCIKWREHWDKIHDGHTPEEMRENLKHTDFYINHVDGCLSCKKWFVKHKGESLDMNNTRGKGDDETDELSGYANYRKEEEKRGTFPEDFIYTPDGGIFPMNRQNEDGSFSSNTCCFYCGSPLDKDGNCTNPRCSGTFA